VGTQFVYHALKRSSMPGMAGHHRISMRPLTGSKGANFEAQSNKLPTAA
jgi:hypothetical protein